MSFTKAQIDQLLKPINAARIEKRQQAGQSLSYLSQHDVRAHAIRIFGFGNFDSRTLSTNVLFMDERDGRWDVAVMVTMEVTVKDRDGDPVCVFSESAVGSSTQGRKGEALDMALKTASSDAFKRCLINLGDQFGLSLYNNGSTRPIVQAVLSDEAAEESA